MNKKLYYRVFAFVATFLFSVAAIYAQAPVRTYVCQKGGVAAHVFSASATTYTFTEDANLNALWLKADGTTEPLQTMADAYGTPPTFTGNISIPEFYFGKTKVKYFGLTGAGCLYFGTEDAISAQANPDVDIRGSSKLKTFVYLEFLNGAYNAVMERNECVVTSVYAGENATAKYEIVGDTLFVGYENLKVYSKNNATTLPLSFQYKITPDGNITLIPVAMRPTGSTDRSTGANYFFFKLGLIPGSGMSENIFLNNLRGTVTTVQPYPGIPNVEITDASYPSESYAFMQPAPCRVIASPKITRWSYNITATEFEINPTSEGMLWAEGTMCIFLLSTKASLTGNDLPQNGTEYSDRAGLKIGTSVFATVAMRDEANGSYIQNKRVTGLTPDTRYYLYAFPYNDTCSNLQYNTTDIPRLEIKTAMLPPSLQVEEASISDTGYVISVAKAGNAPYLLAVSTRQISPAILLTNRLHPKPGGYATGDVITIGNEKIEVLAPCATDASYRVGGLTAGTERWYYAWSTRTDQSEYSYEPICRGFSTLQRVPSTVNFDSAAVNVEITSPAAGGPAGWLFGEDNDNPFYVYEFTSLKTGKILSVRMLKNVEDNSIMHSTAVSPVFESGENLRVGAIFNLYFWKEGSIAGEYLASAPNATDTLYLQYRLDGQEDWTTMATVTNSAKVSEGMLSVKTPAFETAGKSFRLRVSVVSNQGVGRDGSNYASIQSVSVYVPCSEVSALRVSDVMHNNALVTWEDRNNTPRAESYVVNWNESNTAIQKRMDVLVREANIRGLASHTPYEVSVRAVCGAGDTSAEQMVRFTTHRGLPYALKAASDGKMPEEITFRMGDLPATGHASLGEPDKEVWRMAEFGNDSMFIWLKRVKENPLWLRFPVLAVGNTRGKAQLDMTTWGTDKFWHQDSLFVFVSSDSLFSRSEVLAVLDSSYFTTQAHKVSVEFEVETPYLYIALYTKFQDRTDTDIDTIFANHIKVEWTDIYCDPVKSLRQSHLETNSVDISWSGEGLEYALLYREEESEKWDTVFTSETTIHLEGLKSGTSYEYYVLTYCDEEREKVSEKSSTRVFATLEDCDVPRLEILEGTETQDGVVVVVLSSAPKKQLSIRSADLDECPYEFDLIDVQRDTTIIRGLTDCEAVTYYIKARAVCMAGISAWTAEQSFTTLPKSVSSTEEAKLNDALRVRVTADEIILENYTGEYVKELQAFSTTGRRLAVFPVNSSADVRLTHRLPQGAVLLRAISEGAGMATFKVIIL